MSLFRALPPAGTVIPGRVLLKGLRGALFPGDSRERLAREIERGYGVREVHLLNSGRSVLTVLLQAMKEERPDRTEVILPGYTCYSVAAAAVRVGLKVRPVDIDPETFDYDMSQLDAVDTSNTLTLITANLFGIPNDLPRLEEFCRERGIYMIDDAAQAMHARVGDRWAGTFGDAGLFSFDKGKNITTIQGGVLLLQNPELSARVQGIVQGLPEPSVLTSVSLLVKLVLYWLFLRPWLYWIPDRLLVLGHTPFQVSFPVMRFPRTLAKCAIPLLGHEILTLTRKRREVANRLLAECSPGGMGGSSTIDRTFTRLPAMAPSRDIREGLLGDRSAHRLGISRFYPLDLRSEPQLADYLAPAALNTPSAAAVASRLLTLPTHGFVSLSDIVRLDHTIKRLALSFPLGLRQ